jgi:hypothetical protein
MSQFPNMNQPGQPNPFAGGPTAYQQPKKSMMWLWILLGVGGMGLVLCCGCGGVFFYLGLNMAGSEMTARLNSDPAAQEHLGTVTSATLDFFASSEETQRAGGGTKFFVFDVVGDKGTGRVITEQSPGPQQFKNARLELPSGEEVPLGF